MRTPCQVRIEDVVDAALRLPVDASDLRYGSDSHRGSHERSALWASRRPDGDDPRRSPTRCRPLPSDLAPVDEFHLGGPKATSLVADLGLTADMRVLDIGSGLGGPARHMARLVGCQVLGVDLTPGFVATANDLTDHGLDDRTSFVVGDATALGSHGRFDAATLLHVGMRPRQDGPLLGGGGNARTGRSLRDLRHHGDGDLASLAFPQPFAIDRGAAWLAGPDDYGTALRAAGFTSGDPIDRSELRRPSPQRRRGCCRWPRPWVPNSPRWRATPWRRCGPASSRRSRSGTHGGGLRRAQRLRCPTRRGGQGGAEVVESGCVVVTVVVSWVQVTWWGCAHPARRSRSRAERPTAGVAHHHEPLGIDPWIPSTLVGGGVLVGDDLGLPEPVAQLRCLRAS